MKYEFSLPMPLDIDNIKKLTDINSNIKKSKITSLYFSLPSNSLDFTNFENGRYTYEKITDFNYWKPLIEYSMEQGFNFVYLLNFAKIYTSDSYNLNENLEKLDKLINNLRKTGCNKLRVCNPQLIGYINKKYPDFELYLSTLSQLQNIKQYENVFNMFNNIKEFVPSFDLNKNFKFLKNIRRKFPSINIEIMVNEGCISGCPYQTQHSLLLNRKDTSINTNFYFSQHFFLNMCANRFFKNFEYFICNSNIIYPWHIDEYGKIGIYKFKLVGRNNIEFRNGDYLKYYEYYLKGIDNIKNIENVPIRFFNNYIFKYYDFNVTVKDCRKYIPNLSHFNKKGHLCASICGVECRYCYKCAEKIEKILKKDQEKIRKRTTPVCITDKNYK